MAVTSGLVQKMTWSAPIVCAWIGGSAASAELFFLNLAASDSAATLSFKTGASDLLVEAMTAGYPVLIQHDPSGAEIVNVSLGAFVTTDGLEVTQSIQDLNNSVTLIAGKTTVVRVYLSYYLNPPITVSGELTVYGSGSAPTTTIASINTLTLDRAAAGQLDAHRRDVQLSLNFLLPSSLTVAGSHSFALTKLVNTTTGKPLNTSLVDAAASVTFTQGAALRVRLLFIRYQFGVPPASFVATSFDYQLIMSWLLRAYPIAQLVISQATIDATATTPFVSDDINAQVAAIRVQDVANGTDKRTHYFGLVSDGGFFMRGSAAGIPQTPDPSIVAAGPTGSGSYGWDFDGSYGDWYTGHELGHTFGRYHPGSGCGESSDDPNYPYPLGQLAGPDEAHVGFDVGDAALGLPMAALPGTDWHDVMTYCDNQWLSAYTYEGIRVRLLAEDALSAGATPSGGSGGGRPDARFPDRLPNEGGRNLPRKLIHVVATVNLTKTQGKIQYVNPVGYADPSPAPKVADVRLRVQNDDVLLGEFAVEARVLTDASPGDDRRALVDAIIAAPPTANLIHLVMLDAVVDTFKAAGGNPVATDLRVRKTHPSTFALKLADSNPAAGHTYTVQVSTDQGKTWQTLAIGLRSPEFSLDAQQFQKHSALLMRMIATDGFTSSVATSELISNAPSEEDAD